jgi:hypothetical protein
VNSSAPEQSVSESHNETIHKAAKEDNNDFKIGDADKKEEVFAIQFELYLF